MTGKARRKLLSARPAEARRRPFAPWLAVLAGAAMSHAQPASAADFRDPRLDVIHEALETNRSADRRLRPKRMSVGAAQEQAAAQQSRSFDIPTGPLSDVVTAFEAVTGLIVVPASPSIGAVHSPGVKGTMSAEQALAAITEGTGITYRFTTSNTISLELHVAADVQVTGRAPSAVVSSPKYVTPLREVPQTIEIIPRAVFEEQGATTLSEVLRNVPGITIQAGEGGGASSTTGDMFNMRGFNASNSLFVDNVRDDGLIARDVFNLEQVEVFLGPTGTDVGRGNAAGYVNMQTKMPTPAAAYTVNYGFASGEQGRLTVDLNQPLRLGQEDSWLRQTSVRLNGLFQDGGQPGRDLVENERRAIAPSLGLGIGTPTRVSLAAQIMRQDNLPDYGIPGAAWHEPLTPTAVLAKNPVDQTNYYGSTSAHDYDNISQDSYTLRFEHDLNSKVTLRNQTRYNNTHREAVVTALGAFIPADETVTILRQGNDRENQIASNQLSAVARLGGARFSHAVSAGFELMGEEQFAPTLTGLGTRGPVSIYTPNPEDPIANYGPTRTPGYSEGHTDTAALYVFDTIELASRWQLNGGIRWERYDTNYRVVDVAGVVTTDAGAKDDLVSGKAGLLYRLHPLGNVYFSWGTSLTPPGTANFTLSTQPNNQNNPNVDPQKSVNYEFGTKWDLFDSRLSLTGAIFRTENENVIYTVDATAVPPIFNQDDAQLVKGVTIAAAGQITPGWQVLAGIGYLDTALVTQNSANAGNQLLLTPPFSASLWTTYRLPSNLTIGGGLRFQDSVFVNAANTITVPSYSLLDALVEYEFNSNLGLRLNLYNLTDKEYIRSINNNGNRYNPGTPFSMLLTATTRF
jgi:catecholate siderophore receptor